MPAAVAAVASVNRNANRAEEVRRKAEEDLRREALKPEDLHAVSTAVRQKQNSKDLTLEVRVAVANGSCVPTPPTPAAQLSKRASRPVAVCGEEDHPWDRCPAGQPARRGCQGQRRPHLSGAQAGWGRVVVATHGLRLPAYASPALTRFVVLAEHVPLLPQAGRPASQVRHLHRALRPHPACCAWAGAARRGCPHVRLARVRPSRSSRSHSTRSS